MEPNGMAVSLTDPEAFQSNFGADPAGHLRAARLLDPAAVGDGPNVLPAMLSRLMQVIGVSNGLVAVGYGRQDVDDLVGGALQQQRLLATAPKEVSAEDLAGIIGSS